MNATLKRFIQERNSIKSIFRGAKNSRVSIRETKCSCRILTLKFHEEIFTKVTSPLGSRASPRWGSSPHARTTSPRTTYRSRRLFYKSHLSLILSRLLSKSQPLHWVAVWYPLAEAISSVSPLIPNRISRTFVRLLSWLFCVLCRWFGAQIPVFPTAGRGVGVTV